MRYSIILSSRTKGLILLELLINSALSLLIIAFALHIFSVHNYLNLALETKQGKELQRSKLLLYSHKVLSDFDSFRFKIFPRLHKNGRIQFFDGTDLIINKQSNIPDGKSDAISYFTSDLQAALYIKESTPGVQIACPVLNRNLDNQKFKAFLGISNNKILYLLSDNIYRPFDRCWQINLKSTASFYLPESADEINFIRLLIPIYEDYTIYRSAGQTLRYLSFSGTDIIENQPLSDSPESFLFREDSEFSNNFYSLNLSFPESEPREIKFYSSLRKVEPYNFIFNISGVK